MASKEQEIERAEKIQNVVRELRDRRFQEKVVRVTLYHGIPGLRSRRDIMESGLVD